jgi:hypothetical protein
MSYQANIDQWQTTSMQHLPHLSKPQATVLALWSVGMVRARSCALTAVSTMVAAVDGRKEHTIRQRLREGDDEASAKRGTARRTLDVETCLALALDATPLGARCVVLAISVVSRGGAIPVAWVSLPATQKHAWRGEWRRLWRVWEFFREKFDQRDDAEPGPLLRVADEVV